MTNTPLCGARPPCFRVEPFLEAAEILVRCDEPLRALALLENLPGYFRDHEPPEVSQLKAFIRGRLMMPADYARDVHETLCTKEQALAAVKNLTRGRIMLDLVQGYNLKGVSPHVVDLGPADYWLAQGLMELQCIFTYFAFTLAPEAARGAASALEHQWSEVPPNGAPVIFCAGEVIEHMLNPDEILTFVARCGEKPEHITLSTPCYAYDERPNWRGEQIAHLRTYTPAEILSWAQSRFPDYEWHYLVDALVNLRGSLRKR